MMDYDICNNIAVAPQVLCILLQFSTLVCWFVFVFKSFYLILFMTEKYAKGPGTGLLSRMKLCS